MNPRFVFAVKLLGALLLIGLLARLFPPVIRFVEMGARELLYFWWVILLVLLAGWLILGLGGKRK